MIWILLVSYLLQLVTLMWPSYRTLSSTQRAFPQGPLNINTRSQRLASQNAVQLYTLFSEDIVVPPTLLLFSCCCDHLTSVRPGRIFLTRYSKSKVVKSRDGKMIKIPPKMTANILEGFLDNSRGWHLWLFLMPVQRNIVISLQRNLVISLVDKLCKG